MAFPHLWNPCPRNPCFRNSHRRNPSVRNSQLRILVETYLYFSWILLAFRQARCITTLKRHLLKRHLALSGAILKARRAQHAPLKRCTKQPQPSRVFWHGFRTIAKPLWQLPPSEATKKNLQRFPNRECSP